MICVAWLLYCCNFIVFDDAFFIVVVGLVVLSLVIVALAVENLLNIYVVGVCLILIGVGCLVFIALSLHCVTDSSRHEWIIWHSQQIKYATSWLWWQGQGEKLVSTSCMSISNLRFRLHKPLVQDIFWSITYAQHVSLQHCNVSVLRIQIKMNITLLLDVYIKLSQTIERLLMSGFVLPAEVFCSLHWLSNSEVRLSFPFLIRLDTLGAMNASDELTDEQVRQMVFDLESSYNGFIKVLQEIWAALCLLVCGFIFFSQFPNL